MKTAKGVYLDLTESNYSYKIEEFRFYFSSDFYRKNFIEKCEEFVKYEKIKFQNTYKVELANTYLFLFTLYRKIEKRGFYVYDTLLKQYYQAPPTFEICITNIK